MKNIFKFITNIFCHHKHWKSVSDAIAYEKDNVKFYIVCEKCGLCGKLVEADHTNYYTEWDDGKKNKYKR